MKLKYPTGEQANVVNLVEYLTMFIWQNTEVLECLRDKLEDMVAKHRGAS